MMKFQNASSPAKAVLCLAFTFVFAAAANAKPLITAHSGCMRTPQNSIASVVKGIECGADFIEVDLNFAEDGTPVLSHDKPKGGETLYRDALEVLKKNPKVEFNLDVKSTDNLKEAFAMRIHDAKWMSENTKKRAIEKLSTIMVKVGYPDKWRDYSGLEIKKDSYFANVVRSNQFDIAYMVSKIDKPVDKPEWGMTPQTVNAYYNPTTNEICFPAGILQKPFFDMNADDAFNYGAIGVVIGHEMTHGFDDQGRHYDKDGNLNDWWEDEDTVRFKANAQVLVDWFNKVKVSDNPLTYANGQLTLGENIADNGGLHISYQAMQNALAKRQVNDKEMDGFTPAQRFFLAYAGVWASNIREEAKLQLTAADVHSLAENRVNATLPHITEFLEAFGIQPGCAMYLAPELRAQLW